MQGAAGGSGAGGRAADTEDKQADAHGGEPQGDHTATAGRSRPATGIRSRTEVAIGSAPGPKPARGTCCGLVLVGESQGRASGVKATGANLVRA